MKKARRNGFVWCRVAQHRGGIQPLDPPAVRQPQLQQTVKASIPSEVSSVYGPRFTALIGELSGIKGMIRNDVKQLCQSVRVSALPPDRSGSRWYVAHRFDHSQSTMGARSIDYEKKQWYFETCDSVMSG
jgi:hypothetical protein